MYVKVFEQIFDSSIAENWKTRHVFEDMLKLADADGVVDMTPESISRRTNIPIKIVQESIVELCLPDPRSRTPDHDGRRLVLLDDHRDWGWRVVNYHSYREMRSADERREYFREAKAKQREKEKSKTVKDSQRHVNMSTPSEAEAEADSALRLSRGKPSRSEGAKKRISGTERTLMAKCLKLFGKSDYETYGGNWRKRARDDPDRLARVLNETQNAVREKRVRETVAAYANDCWRRFT